LSRRHQTSISVERIPKRERRWSTHQERQAVRGVLKSGVDPEDLLTPKVVHHGPRTHDAKPPRPRRHWKLKVWKRRTALRHQRAEALERMADAP
jgi:hypothetical protein